VSRVKKTIRKSVAHGNWWGIKKPVFGWAFLLGFSNHAYWKLARNLTPTEMGALMAFLQSRKKTSLILFNRAIFTPDSLDMPCHLFHGGFRGSKS